MLNKDFTIHVEDFNKVVLKPELIKKLRKLTLERYSGMNYELTHLQKASKFRKVNCKVLTVHKDENIVAWALLSKEDTDFLFPVEDGFKSTDGTLFEVFVQPEFRRKGIGTELMRVARRKSGNRLCIVPHDYASDKFYEKFAHYKAKKL